jgi:hypothetical protein
MTSKLTDEQNVRIRILQYLSMLYVSTNPSLSIVSSRQIAQVLSLAVYDVEDVLDFFSSQRFVELNGTPTFSAEPHNHPPSVMEARLSPETWVTNGNRVSGFYAHFVANAPSIFRGKQPTYHSTTIFDGIFEHHPPSRPTETFPVESYLMVNNRIDLNLTTTDNLISLNIYRTLLRSLFAYGRGGTSFAEWLDHGPPKKSNARIYCLAETDEALLGSLPSNPALSVATSVGGNPFGSVSISLIASDGTPIIYNPFTQMGESSVSVNGGIPVPAKALGLVAHGVLLVSVLKRLS